MTKRKTINRHKYQTILIDDFSTKNILLKYTYFIFLYIFYVYILFFHFYFYFYFITFHFIILDAKTILFIFLGLLPRMHGTSLEDRKLKTGNKLKSNSHRFTYFYLFYIMSNLFCFWLHFLFCFVLFCFVLFQSILFYFIELYFITLFYTVLDCFTPCPISP